MPVTEEKSRKSAVETHSSQPQVAAYGRAATGGEAVLRPHLPCDTSSQDSPQSEPVLLRIGAGAPAAHPPGVAHHFHSALQQSTAARVGMWVFLATEVMMFGGLFTLYGTFRYLWPEAFAYGHAFLDVGWGLINTVVMVLSSLTMALAVYCAQRNHHQALMLFLSLTIICGICFLGVKAIEYRHKIEGGLLWGGSFDPVQTAPAMGDLPPVQPVEDVVPLRTAAGAMLGDPANGRRLYMSTCMGCHGADGEGIGGVAPALRGSRFVTEASLEQVLALIRDGRQPDDPASVMNALMPARGGNPFLSETDVADIAAHVRAMNGGAEGASGVEIAAATPSELPVDDVQLFVPRWAGTRPPQADTGLAPPWRLGTVVPASIRPEHIGPPEHAAHFFSLYFLMTGLHGIHVVIGISVVAWLLWRASRWHFSSAYSTPVEMGGLYWHVVDLIWLMLFPLFYLVH